VTSPINLRNNVKVVKVCRIGKKCAKRSKSEPKSKKKYFPRLKTFGQTSINGLSHRYLDKK